MTAIQRQRIVWTGFSGAPGVTTLYFSNAAESQAAVHDFCVGLANYLPPVVHLSVEPGGDVIEDTNGALTQVWAGTQQADVVGVGASPNYSSVSGALIRWETLAIRSGSRLRGRSYIVPLTDSAYATDGTLTAQAKLDFGDLASIFIGAVTPNMLVWQRPRTATAAYTDGRGIPHKALSGRLGSSAVVVTSSVPDRVVVLRSRRD